MYVSCSMLFDVSSSNTADPTVAEPSSDRAVTSLNGIEISQLHERLVSQTYSWLNDATRVRWLATGLKKIVEIISREILIRNCRFIRFREFSASTFLISFIVPCTVCPIIPFEFPFRLLAVLGDRLSWAAQSFRSNETSTAYHLGIVTRISQTSDPGFD